MKTILFAALLAVMPVATFAQERPMLDEGQRDFLTQTCKHYVNRAKFKPRGPDQDFITTMADACEGAAASLTSPIFAERDAARHFLAQARSLRDLIIDMNMTRVFGTNYTKWTRIKYEVGSMQEQVRRVSRTGEYLIAKQIGVIDAYEAWLEATPVRALAMRKMR